jgi:hypothetical protein
MDENSLGACCATFEFNEDAVDCGILHVKQDVAGSSPVGRKTVAQLGERLSKRHPNRLMLLDFCCNKVPTGWVARVNNVYHRIGGILQCRRNVAALPALILNTVP